MPVSGWHHVCPIDVWRGVAGLGQIVQVAGSAWGPPRCPVCHGAGHGGRSPSSGPPGCPGADWAPMTLAATEAAIAKARRAEGDRRALVWFLIVLLVGLGALAGGVLLVWAGASGG